MDKPKDKKSKEIRVWVTALSLTSHITSSPLSVNSSTENFFFLEFFNLSIVEYHATLVSSTQRKHYTTGSTSL